MRIRILATLCCCVVSLTSFSTAKAEPFTVPEPLRAFSKGDSPKKIMDRFLSVPYRQDGMVDDTGRYSLFASPEKIFPTPGLNCSGLTLEGARLLLGRNISFKDVMRDRLGDSGVGAAKGQDWDFGWDIIMNISEGYPRALITLKGNVTDFASLSGTSPLGIDPHAPGFWEFLLPRIKRDKLYLVSFSKHKSATAPAHLHYHVGLIFRGQEPQGSSTKAPVWLYHTTHNSGKAVRLNLMQTTDQKRFQKSFRNTSGSLKRLSIVEIPMDRR